MKKNLITLSAIALLAIACEKEETTPVSSTDVTAKKQSTNEKLNRTHIWKEFTIHPETGDGVCYTSLSTCLDEVVINGMTQMNIANFTVLKSKILEGNKVEVQTLFKEHESLLQQYMRQDYIDGVVDGSMEVGIKENSLDSYSFIHLYNADDQKRILTLPLKF